MIYNRLKKGVLSEIEKKHEVKFEISEVEWEAAVKAIRRDLLYNNLSFNKEATYVEFVERIYIYLSMLKRLEML
ncbi:hypothetical protein JYU21_01525 [Alkaliphilus sp. AH-315-G20]|nr:hypothetical protein [Alkaliphilus sp. AH-315-G20]